MGRHTGRGSIASGPEMQCGVNCSLRRPGECSWGLEVRGSVWASSPQALWERAKREGSWGQSS